MMECFAFLEAGGVESEDLDEEVTAQVAEEALAARDEGGGDTPSVEEALSGPHKEGWKKAMNDELDVIEGRDTYTIILAPEDINLLDGRWTLRVKRNGEGEVTCLKARYVVKGFKQKFGETYHKTFAPMVHPTTLRILLFIAAHNGSTIVQADAKNAYLSSHNDINEIFYMRLPEHYLKFRKIPSDLAKYPLSKLACIVWHPLYGSKQGANRFYKYLVDIMVMLGFMVSLADEAVFYKFDMDGKYVIVAAATDDFTIIADCDNISDAFQDKLSKHLKLVRLRKINWLLGVTVTRDLKACTISLGQEAYIEHIAKRFGLKDACTVTTPLLPQIDLTPGSEHISA